MKSDFNRDDEIKYYETFTGYRHPVKLKNQISKEQISEKSTYYIAKYQDNMIVQIYKVHNGKTLFEYRYFYVKNKLSKAIIIGEDDELMLYF